ncbi:MAG: LPS-assembly protein LptD [Sulfuricaulis sp.]
MRKKPRPPAAANLPIDIRAQKLTYIEGDVGEFIGNVEMHQGDQLLTTDRLRYDQATSQADAVGNVSLKDSAGSYYQTQQTRLNLESRVGYAGPGTFRLDNNFARGDAQHIDFQGPDVTVLTQVRYTTCAVGRDDWYLKMRKLKLDTQTEIGTAHNTSLVFMGVPVFYLPYLDFPISDERKSGFLMPRFGGSSKHGLEAAAPYYFNLAPNYDDTFTPQIMSERGLQLQDEFRYLTPHSTGQLELETLPHDRLANGANRTAISYQHNQVFNPLWSGKINMQHVSDDNYFSDFGDDIGLISQTYLPQNAEVDYNGPLWRFSALASANQTIDPTIAFISRPYNRMPQLDLTLNRPLEPNQVNYYFDSEAVNFQRSDSITGERLNLGPAVSLPLTNSYGFVTPKLSVREISYHLLGAPDATLVRGIFSVDSGLYFDRDISWGDRPFTQTLEPRLYYLYVPPKGQDGLPNFDTSVPDLSFSNLFRDNRFVGGDRIGDANQITTGVTTRFIDDNDGKERARASGGMIYYLSDRQVNLPPGPSNVATSASFPAGPSNTVTSSFVGEASATLDRSWYARGNVQWDRGNSRLPEYSYYFQYNPEKNRIINVGKQFSSGALAQWDVSTAWPISGRWSFRARSIYSTQDKRNVYSYAGVAYNACCWTLNILASRRLLVDTTNNNAASQINSINFELELTGLSKSNHVSDNPLQQSMFSFPSTPAAAPESAAP